jgi:peptide methionine sulfoxide reductase MsrA
MPQDTTKCLVVYYDGGYGGAIVEYLTYEQIKEYSSDHKDVITFDMNDFQHYNLANHSWEVVTDGK